MSNKLIKEFYDKEQDIAFKLKQREENPKSWSYYNDLYDVLKEEGYDLIGSGHSRVVFSKSDVPFVVKLASYPDSGIAANKSEISCSSKSDSLDLSLKNSSNQVSDILPELYSYSKAGYWIICEKVIPIEEVSIDKLIKAFPTLHYFVKKKTLDNGNVVDRNIDKYDFLKLIDTIFYRISTKPDINLNIALSIIKQELFLIYDEDYDLKHIKNTLPLIDIKRFIAATSYDYTADLHKKNLGIRNQKNISPDSFLILDFDFNTYSYKNKVRHFFDKNPDHPSNPRHDAKLISNESVVEAVYKRLMIESLKQNKKYSGSHPEESYRYGWPEFDESELDKEGLTTWHKDRKLTKKYLKSIGLL